MVRTVPDGVRDWVVEDAEGTEESGEEWQMMIAESTMSPTRANVGRKRRPPSGRSRKLRHRFARRLHTLAGDITNREIAEVCGVSPASVSQWFAGNQIPEFDLWPDLARALGVTVRDLLPEM